VTGATQISNVAVNKWRVRKIDDDVENNIRGKKGDGMGLLGMGKKVDFFQEIVDYIVDFLGRNSRQIVEKKSKIVDFQKLNSKLSFKIAVMFFGLKFLPLRLNLVGPLKIMPNYHRRLSIQLLFFKTDHKLSQKLPKTQENVVKIMKFARE